jgi:putative oxidoreductase
MNTQSSIFAPARQPWPERAHALLRIISGLLFITFGTMKIFGWPPAPGPMPPIPLASQIGIGGLLEVVGGLLVLAGFLTRPTAFVLAGEMAVAYFQFHHPQAFFPTANNGVPAVLYCFLFLYFMVAGAGPWSVDAAITRRARKDDRSASRVT